MGFLSEPTHWIFILLLLVVVFGAKRLPELGKGLGEGLKGFKEGIKGVTDPTPAQPTQYAAAPVQPAPPATVAPAAVASDFIVCTRCGTRFDNPNGFPVSNFVCRSCAAKA